MNSLLRITELSNNLIEATWITRISVTEIVEIITSLE